MKNKRTKTVFSSNSQVCHVWAQQTQEYGRANHIYFQGDTIYSYGSHFPAARIHTDKKTGNRYALVTNRKYSISTAKHLSEIRSSLSGLMPYYTVPDIDVPNSKENIEYLTNSLKERIVFCFRGGTTYCESWKIYIDYYVPNEFQTEVNQFRAMFGLSELNLLDDFVMEGIKQAHRQRVANTAKRKSPEYLAAKQAKLEKQLQQDITKFRATGIVRYTLYALPNELLYINHNTQEVITSRGARVSLQEAKALLKALQAGAKVYGKTIGSFTVGKLEGTVENGILTIGCHRISMVEATQVLGGE